MKKVFIIAALALCLAGCNEYYNVPPNAIGMVLTPTGYDGKIQTPGQVNLGDINTTNGEGNSLVLIERNGVPEKESFAGRDASEDHEDHRCLTGQGEPATIDVRMLLALPDYKTKEGTADLQRLLLLGRPVNDKNQKRTMWITAQSVYRDQAQQQARGRIRQVCAQYPTFDGLLKAFGDDTANGLTKKIEVAISHSMVEAGVPLRLVNATVSNLKPDPTVLDAISARLASEKRVDAIKVVTDFLSEDKTGGRQKVYNLQVIQEIVAKAGSTGHNTIFMTDVGTPGVVPLPMSSAAAH